MEKEISITFDLSEIRAILDNLALIEWELYQKNSLKTANTRAICDMFKFSEKEWEIILNR